jgi:nucleotide-binding universal stress UspA family protein
MIKKLLVAYDGSEPARKAVEMAALIAEGRPSLVTLLGVVELSAPLDGEIPPEIQERIAKTEELLQEASRKFAHLGCNLETDVQVGNVTDTILGMAQEGNYDLIVIGDKARSRLVEFFLGSTAYDVSRKACCSVVLVR